MSNKTDIQCSKMVKQLDFSNYLITCEIAMVASSTVTQKL